MINLREFHGDACDVIGEEAAALKMRTKMSKEIQRKKRRRERSEKRVYTQKKTKKQRDQMRQQQQLPPSSRGIFWRELQVLNLTNPT